MGNNMSDSATHDARSAEESREEAKKDEKKEEAKKDTKKVEKKSIKSKFFRAVRELLRGYVMAKQHGDANEIFFPENQSGQPSNSRVGLREARPAPGARPRAVVRVDNAHRGAEYPHVNLDPGYFNLKKDPHIRIPKGTPEALRQAGKGVKLFNKIAVKVAVATEVVAAIDNARKDWKEGTVRNSTANAAGVATGFGTAFAGGRLGALLGSPFGPGGTVIGGVLGSLAAALADMALGISDAAEKRVDAAFERQLAFARSCPESKQVPLPNGDAVDTLKKALNDVADEKMSRGDFVNDVVAGVQEALQDDVVRRYFGDDLAEAMKEMLNDSEIRSIFGAEAASALDEAVRDEEAFMKRVLSDEGAEAIREALSDRNLDQVFHKDDAVKQMLKTSADQQQLITHYLGNHSALQLAEEMKELRMKSRRCDNCGSTMVYEEGRGFVCPRRLQQERDGTAHRNERN